VEVAPLLTAMAARFYDTRYGFDRYIAYILKGFRMIQRSSLGNENSMII